MLKFSHRSLVKLILILALLISAILEIAIIQSNADHHTNTQAINFDSIQQWSHTGSQQFKNEMYKREHPPKPINLQGIEITRVLQVSKKACLPSISLNSITIKGDGSVTYINRQEGTYPTKSIFQIPAATIQHLVDELYKIDFFSLKPQQLSKDCSIDNYSDTYLFFVPGGFRKEIIFADNKPAELAETQKMIAQIIMNGLPNAVVSPMQVMNKVSQQRTIDLLNQLNTTNQISLQTPHTKKLYDELSQPYPLIDECLRLTQAMLEVAEIRPVDANKLIDSIKNQ